MKLVIGGSGTVIAESVELAQSMVTRMVGLLGRTQIPRDHALVLFHCSSIHMFMMMFTIDVIFISEDRRVVALFPHRRPFSFPVGKWGAAHAIEIAAGRIAECGVKVGDQLSWD